MIHFVIMQYVETKIQTITHIAGNESSYEVKVRQGREIKKRTTLAQNTEKSDNEAF